MIQEGNRISTVTGSFAACTASTDSMFQQLINAMIAFGRCRSINRRYLQCRSEWAACMDTT